MKRMKALVIDDEQIVLDSVRRVLTEENFDVETTLNSKTGLGLALDNVYDIVLTDIRMRELDGISVLLDISTEAVYAGGYHHGLCHVAIRGGRDEVRRRRLHPKALYSGTAHQQSDRGDWRSCKHGGRGAGREFSGSGGTTD